jgi:hypothetical protein
MSEPKCMRLSRRRQPDHGHRDSNDQSKEMSHHLSIREGQKSSLVWYLQGLQDAKWGTKFERGKWKERQDLARWDEVISDCFDLVSQSLARSMDTVPLCPFCPSCLRYIQDLPHLRKDYNAFLGLGNRGLE